MGKVNLESMPSNFLFAPDFNSVSLPNRDLHQTIRSTLLTISRNSLTIFPLENPQISLAKGIIY